MRIECIRQASEIHDGKAGVIVFPEYSDPAQIAEASRARPEAILVAAVRDGTRSRAVVWHNGQRRVRYLKIGSDGSTQGTGILPPQLPVYETPEICLGVLICMDVQRGKLVQDLVGRIERSESRLKLICIPARMGSEWFSNEATNAPLNRVCVALCNEPEQDRPRAKSFIADASGAKVRQQIDKEPISWEF